MIRECYLGIIAIQQLKLNEQLYKPKNALISVFNKEGLEPIINELSRLGVEIFSTGGTQSFIENLGKKLIPEELTSYPSILGEE